MPRKKATNKKKQKVEEKAEKYIRPDWDEYFMEIAKTVAKRSTCDRGRGGCVIVRDKQILTTGYVGSPKGLPHCDDVGHQLKQTVHENGEMTTHCVRTIHMEQNAICQAARLGVALEGATLYGKYEPCVNCAKMIINCGIKRVVCEKKYNAAKDTRAMFKKAKIKLEVLKNELETYDKM
ncbi:TPA: cell division protein DedD [Candidatus Berkelbacteria bacterium]|uniref:CMP/dCMP deaminase zinc-binding protein, dCMP deaminase n=1 Tax=Berkelbacteria bacterium GW2011_GWE1_39_12 TaxID=1618337 RepID=A0A0G4B4M6_9BACT|nr:MAG: CMP/dCMP deaminase zinc-binding protein, dCMP deaminase [Berkelbacteria bacterium GW2011_GWE1_39_12]HBO60346.1 cell division protein DedD [Candidatus Berkelbacteria bacterium]